MVFFNTTSGTMTDTQVRRALVQGTDVSAIQQRLGYPTRPVREPILKGQVGYDASVQQLGYDVDAAKATLDKAGWLVGKAGIRYKDKKPLTVNLAASRSREHSKVTKSLQADWQKLGVRLELPSYDAEDFQNTLSAHNYDAILYGISIGVDPDIFVYWHSTQTDPRSTRLNLSLYKSAAADAALDAGRTRLEPALRTIKYKPFLQTWQQDAPAIGLYQPRFQYVSHTKIYGLDAKVLNNGTDRLNNVQNWMVLTTEKTND
jgi:peptide/nickel transport system substrate-binding protein